MAEAATASHIPTLSEQYLLKDNAEKVDVASKPVEAKDVKLETVLSEEKAAEAPVAASEEKAEDTSDAAAAEEKAEDTSDAAAPEEKTEDTPAENSSEDVSSVDAESNETTEDQKVDEESSDETPEIKLETAPADFRFPTTNQTRHCFTRYIEYHRCIAAKGQGAQECDRFAKYYRSLCPSEWVERWNEQRENGTFPGPL